MVVVVVVGNAARGGLAGSRKRSVDGGEGEGEGVCGWTPRGLVTRVENEAEAEEERKEVEVNAKGSEILTLGQAAPRGPE